MKTENLFPSLKLFANELVKLNSDYTCKPEKIEELEKMCRTSHLLLHQRDLMMLLEDCRLHNDKDTTMLAEIFVAHKGNMLSEILFRYWQNHYQNPTVLTVCRRYTEQLKKEENFLWKNNWRLWIRTNNPQKAAAKTFAETNLSYLESLEKFSVNKSTAFELATEVFFYYYCSPELFVTVLDGKLFLLTKTFSDFEKCDFLSKMLNRFPIMTKTGKFLPHELFTENYFETVTNMIPAALTIQPENQRFLLLNRMLTAHSIPDKMHQHYWEYHFLKKHTCWKYYNYFLHSSCFEIQFENGCIILDFWQEQTILILPASASGQNFSIISVAQAMELCPLCVIQKTHWKYYLDQIKEEYLFMSDVSENMFSVQDDVSIKKLSISYSDENGRKNQIIKQFSDNGTKNIHLPDNSNISEICLTDQKGKNYIIDFKLFQKMVIGDYDAFTSDEQNKIPFFFDGNSINIDYDVEYADANLPEMKYSDHTEKYMLHFQEIAQNEIENREKGLWSHHGIRLLHFYIENIPEEEYKSIEGKLIFDKIDNEILEEPVSFKCRKVENPEKQEYFIPIDTDSLGEKISALFPERRRIMFRGTLQLLFVSEYVSDELPISETYMFDTKMIFVNTGLKDFDSDSSVINTNNAISIDFGTSSTCVAIDDDNDQTRLIELTGKADEEHIQEINSGLNVNVYENPTNLMLYHWDSLYNQWKQENTMHPVPHKHIGATVLDDEEHEFDFGYSVKAGMSEADKRFCDAVITQLKMVPYDNAHKKQSTVFPFESGNTSVLYLVNHNESEDENHFDPIAFYGYLLGRAVNNPQNGKIYMNYYVTFPVKFEPDVRKSIQKSLEYGIKRSLPQPLRDMTDDYGDPLFQLNMELSEPVAYAGAICGKDVLSLVDDPKPKLFAVFDFGGGTLDFSFCMYRLANEEEQDEGYESVLQIFGVDGDATLGGERLINQLSYWIVSSEQNIENIRKDGEEFRKSIPFVRPEGELKLDGCDNLFLEEKNASQVARVNTRHLNEAFSRQLFENGSDNSGAESIDLALYTQDEEQVFVNLTINYDVLNENLRERISNAITNFHHSMMNTFALPHVEEILKQYDVSVDSAYIFLAGNTSRHPMVMECMKEFFQEDRIAMIDERFQNEDYDERYSGYKITPKTAVAIGQAKLIAARYTCKVDSPEEHFAWYVAKSKIGDNLERLIEKNTTDRCWRKVGPIKGGAIRVVYSANVDFSGKKVQPLRCDRADENKICYIRPFENSGLEYIAVAKDKSPDDFEGTPRQIKLN